MSTTGAAARTIHSVCLTVAQADEHAHHLREQGRHPRVHERTASAENLSIIIHVVVCDEKVRS